ncbi:hypothetical protein GALMADRAFT_250326 [Galerina marginata CBS 339.88]|uniref:Peptidase C14 caspase domain-containing protein n=1 Tax=Galerina marginata (strain CBS 339.88) TaxID=685588 RepID=A0A067SWJ2_GALM3|nr:hypothetical protein GALMADRAFT_250326 [Galerina marginata CBS 339.88]
MSAFTIDSGFALCIGIDKYQSSTIPPLRGAVADARAVAGYLRQLKVPEHHVTLLENESATRHAILQGLRDLANDPRIQYGNPIVVFYAGHGSEAAAPEWEGGGPNANIQLTVPYDAYCESGGEVVVPIPDRTLGALLEAIAQQKGNNIVVIMDSCYSASGTRSFDNSSNIVRCIPLPPDFHFEGRLEADAWPLQPTSTSGGLLSHVLLSACGSTGQAWEAHDRGVFTAALLDLLKDSQIDKLRYCDIVMRMDIDTRQIPHCEGINRERYIFTTTSAPPTEYFIPAHTRISKKGPFNHVLNGGAAHGLVVGDEFNVYPDIDCQESLGILVIKEVGSFYSITRHPLFGLQLAANSVAVRIKKGKHEPLRIPTADFPEITQHVKVDMYELQQSRSKFPGSPTAELLSGIPVPFENGSFILQQGCAYGLKLTNNSPYNLYPTVHSSNLLQFDPWYRPPCSRSRLDVPLMMGGGSLTIGYGSGGSPPLVIASSHREGHGSLKILLSTQPLDPLYDDKSFRLAHYLPETIKGPWATVSRAITYRLSNNNPRVPSEHRPKEFLISNPTRLPSKPCVPRSLALFQGQKKSLFFLGLDPDLSTDHFGGVLKKSMSFSELDPSHSFMNHLGGGGPSASFSDLSKTPCKLVRHHPTVHQRPVAIRLSSG